MAYQAVDEIMARCEKDGVEFWKAVQLEDCEENGISEEESWNQMTHMWNSMKESVAAYDPEAISRSGLVGREGKLMDAYREQEKPLCGDFVSKVIANALKMGCNNACMKRIVAAPTAGACGVMPAVLVTYYKEYEASEETMIQAMYVAAGIGQVIASRASLAGASGGCQAEIGSASGMAAAAICSVRGGSKEQMGYACAMALKNLMGLVCDPGLVGTVSTSYSVDSVFEKFGAYPQQWIENADGEIVYGSLTEETKEALGYLRELYRQGILDSDFALRAQNNIRDLVVNGKCGAFFGLWWTPNNPLMDEYRKNKEADWEPYYLTADVKRTVEVYSTFRDNKYVVVRKGYEHPEIAMKILSVLFDHSRYEAEDADEMNTYFALNVDPTARPLMINVDYNEATYIVTKHIREVLYSPGDEKTREDLSAIEASYFDACKEYLEAEVPSVEAWAAYKSRISAVGLLVDANYRAPEKKYLGDGDGEIPQTLRLLEKNAFIQIIMGRMPVSSFDSFVEDWYRKGGDSLTERVREGLVDS